MTDESRARRRTFLKRTGVALVGATALAGCSGGGSSDSNGGGNGSGGGSDSDGSGGGSSDSNGGGKQSFGGWLEKVSNYDGVHDKTGSSTVTVEVGVDANGGAYGFGPAAVKVSTGTTVKWKWTGQGASHNVVHRGGAFESKMHSNAGVHFEHTFDSAGTYKYYCTPHKALGMKGVVVVE